MNVLIVEDDLPFLELLRHALKPRKVRVAHSMSEALTMIDLAAPEVLVLDLALPDSSAAATLARLQDLKARSKDATVIVITGSLDDRVRTEALERGADLFISKDVGGFFSSLSRTLLDARPILKCANESTVAKVEREVGKIVAPEK